MLVWFAGFVFTVKFTDTRAGTKNGRKYYKSVHTSTIIDAEIHRI